MAETRRAFVLSALLAAALSSAPARAAVPSIMSPPFDVSVPSGHAVEMTVETRPAREILAVLGAGPDAPAALERLRSSRAVRLAFAKAPGGPEGLYGRLASAAAGRPDPAMKALSEGAARYRVILDAIDTAGPSGAGLEARRLASLLPAEPRVSGRFVVVPAFGLSSFTEVATLVDGETTYLVADVVRLLRDQQGAVADTEMTLRVLRACTAEAWRILFERAVRPRPGWAPPAPGAGESSFGVLLDHTVAEGPAILFLLPDEFYPLSAVLEEPIGRAFGRWNEAAATLLDPKVKPDRKEMLLAEAAGKDDFWARYDAIVGAQVADSVLRLAGREAWTKALAEGPRAVLSLYLKLSSDKAAGLPRFGKAPGKALSGPGGAAAP